MSRWVCQFSCGAASAVATKLVLAEQPAESVLILNAFIQEEDEDNRRFLKDCERWFNHPITVVQDTKFNASTLEVWRRRRYIQGMYGAPCSAALKRDLLDAVKQPDDIVVLGYTADEQDRFDRFVDANAGRKVVCPLIERNLSKADCLAIIDRAGIELPAMYRRGYDNANCIGCPKGGQAYWQSIRQDFPQRFADIEAIQRTLGPGAYFLRFRSGERKGERMSLADLPTGRGNMKEEPSFSCSFFCEMAEQDMRPV